MLTPLVIQAASDSPSASGWVRINDGSISAYTQGDPAQAESLIHSFAQLGNAFAQATAFHPVMDSTLKVIIFNSPKEFNQYRLNAGSSAFYQQTNRGEYVVLQTGGPARQEVAMHEYTHFLMAHSHVNLPLWMNEGLADFYSTTTISDGQATFGGAVSGRLQILRSSPWLTMEQLFAVSTNSAEYMDPHRMVTFYSESWILAHMLVTDARYAERFPLFLRCVNDGHSSTESFQTIYGKTLAQVEQDLREHTRERLTKADAKIRPLADHAILSAASSVNNQEIQVALADLNVTDPAARATIETRLAAVASGSPGSPAAEESLGFLALRQGKEADARTHFRSAVTRNSSDPNVLFYLAHLDHEAGIPAEQTMPLLERALSMKPDLSDARLELGLEAAGDGKFEQALETLQKLTSVRPENAYAAAYTVAYCYANTDQITEARAAIRRAQALTANEHDKAELRQLSEFIDQQAAN